MENHFSGVVVIRYMPVMITQEFEHFYVAQKHNFTRAFSEIKDGRKASHWMWFIFPQLAGLGFSEMARQYAIRDIAGASVYLKDPVLGERLVSISRQLLAHGDKTAHDIFGSPDDMKLRSSMTLFSLVPDADPVFQEVLNLFFQGERDPKTLEFLQRG
ncbi:MAG: DUF1810 domain-containing protein [Daejeonella sp.]|uniref:DUF1810 domain-containing protein n=1 Tax=Daejeonella sp. JGW-45 TaxID=3034148 RepID=UPI0023EC718A|nr:DUF1810 domain-containing protein [Daejeonella sp. JGW-45]